MTDGVSVLDLFSPVTREWFERAFARPTPAQEAGLAGDRLGRAHADPGADRVGQDARRVPLRDRPAERGAGGGAPAALRLSAEGAELRRRAQPARAARRDPVGADRGRPHRRHAAEGARGDAAQAAGHPDHHARVALSCCSPRRGARCSGRVRTLILDEVHAVAGTKRGAHLALSVERLDRLVGEPVQRVGALGHAAPDRGDRPVRVGRAADPASSTRARARSSTSGSSSRSRTCASWARSASSTHPVVQDGVEMDIGTEVGARSIWPSIYPALLRARQGAPLDDRLRQQPPPRRTACAAAERARSRSEPALQRSPAPTTDRSRGSSGSRSRSC